MKFFLLPALYVLFTIALTAQSPAKILKQAEQAMGGAKVLRTVTSWQKRGTVTRRADGATGKFVVQTSAPNLYNISFDVGGFEIESSYNGKSGWRRDSRTGLRTLTGDEGVDFQAEAAFRSSLWLDVKKQKGKIVAGGKAEIAGRPANVVAITNAKGSTTKLFFDSATNDLVREQFEAGESTRAFEYSDFRRVNGVSQPHRIKMEIDGAVFDVVLNEIRPNASIGRWEFDFPQVSSEPLPEIAKLLEEVEVNEERVEKLLDTYSYVQKSIFRELGKDGVLRETSSHTLQMSFYKGQRMPRLIEKDGKPLSAEDQEKEDKRAAKQAEEIEERIAKREASGDKESGERRISIAEMLRASTLSNPRRERFRGRDVIVFDFEPNPSFDYKNAKSMLKFFGKTAGAMWIDEKDKQVARLEAFLVDSFNIAGGVLAKLRTGASFTLEQERVNDEIWLPSVADLNLSLRIFLVKGIDLNQVIRSYDYRKFVTEVKDAKVNPAN